MSFRPQGEIFCDILANKGWRKAFLLVPRRNDSEEYLWIQEEHLSKKQRC